MSGYHSESINMISEVIEEHVKDIDLKNTLFSCLAILDDEHWERNIEISEYKEKFNKFIWDAKQTFKEALMYNPENKLISIENNYGYMITEVQRLNKVIYDLETRLARLDSKEHKYKFYYLNDNMDIVGTDDITVWGKWIEDPEKQQLRLLVQEEIGDYFVSTVFLTMDHSWRESYPILFETMVFKSDKENYCERYRTLEEALKRHKEIINLIRKNDLSFLDN